ncbi:(2Fe-2S) ferredoxin domain-containing protein [Rhodopseudomonas palustris]|uniref:(2Fe-2S) ferredoxin domain-containing protein n=1 Tax=Rhodopseudomonas palustris TaxID=1076 RepID=UPI0006426901|nr:(2Fe-2S) ferredoxin domain-containing protein [Rhodopseudomonas palustris]
MTIMPTKSSLPIARPKRPPPVLICGKCLSKIDGGKKLKQALKAELKHAADAQGGKRPKLVTTGCLGICPKRAVVTASAATLGRGEYVLIGSRDEAGEAVTLLTQNKDAGRRSLE